MSLPKSASIVIVGGGIPQGARSLGILPIGELKILSYSKKTRWEWFDGALRRRHPHAMGC